MTTLSDVKSRLITSFNCLTPKTVLGCIRKANDELIKIHMHIMRTETDDYEEIDEDIVEETDSSNEHCHDE